MLVEYITSYTGVVLELAANTYNITPQSHIYSPNMRCVLNKYWCNKPPYGYYGDARVHMVVMMLTLH